MTREELWEWLDTCPANFDEDGNRVADPAWDVHTDEFETVVIGFSVIEED